MVPPSTDSESPFAREAAVFLNIMDEMAPQLGLDYSVDSIQRLEDFVAEHFDPPGSKNVSDSLMVGIGCYVGEVIIRQLGGHWNDEGRPDINDVGPVEAVFPIDKARKRFQNGPEDSLHWYYHSVARQVHTTRPTSAPEGEGGLFSRLMSVFRRSD